jgi:nucleoid-associated protein YgaU
MNKPTRILVAVVVLIFAAASLYYTWFSQGKPTIDKRDLEKPSGPKIAVDTGKPEEMKLVASAPTSSAPVTVSSTVPPPGAPPESAFNAPSKTTQPTVPPGFKPDTTPMQPLPSSLPGFTPVTAAGAPTGTGSTSPSLSTGPAATAPSPATIAPVPGATHASERAAPPSGSTVPPPMSPPAVTPTGAEPKAPTKPASTPPAASTITHVVVEGDTLSSIARKYWNTAQGWERIVQANPGVDPNHLKLGAHLVIPAKAAAMSGAAETAKPTKPAGTPAAGGKASDYEVVSGDTLSRISAAVYGDSKHWKVIYDANRKVIGDDPAALSVGMKLTIPPKPDGAAPVASPPASAPSKPGATTRSVRRS